LTLKYLEIAKHSQALHLNPAGVVLQGRHGPREHCHKLHGSVLEQRIPIDALYKMHKTKNICTADCTELSDLYMEFTLLSSASYANSPEKLDQDFKASYGFPYLKSCYHFLSTSVESSWGKWQGVQFDVYNWSSSCEPNI
jgi:hypothetical protein